MGTIIILVLKMRKPILKDPGTKCILNFAKKKKIQGVPSSIIILFIVNYGFWKLATLLKDTQLYNEYTKNKMNTFLSFSL